MKKYLLLILLIIYGYTSFAQVNSGLVELGNYYRQFMLRNAPPENILNDFKKYDNTDLAFTANFIKETLSPTTDLLSDKFLVRPNDNDLKYIYIVEQINYNIRKDKPVDNDELIGRLMKEDISTEEILDNYYSMLFIAYGNKVKPYDMSAINFDINSYHLKNDSEKGIFFLQSMAQNGSMIWGYINIVKPPRYEEALKYIDKYPKYNGSPYYQYLNFSFPDFKIHIESEKRTQSYKEYYINKYYDVLLSHLACLENLGKNNTEIEDLILGSILKEKNYYKYSEKESELKKLLTVYKK